MKKKPMKRLRGNEILEVVGTGRGKNSGVKRFLHIQKAGSIRKTGEQRVKGHMSGWGEVVGHISENDGSKIVLRVSDGDRYFGATAHAIGHRALT